MPVRFLLCIPKKRGRDKTISLMCFGEKEIFQGRLTLGLWTGQGEGQQRTDQASGLTVNSHERSRLCSGKAQRASESGSVDGD